MLCVNFNLNTATWTDYFLSVQQAVYHLTSDVKSLEHICSAYVFGQEGGGKSTGIFNAITDKRNRDMYRIRLDTTLIFMERSHRVGSAVKCYLPQISALLHVHRQCLSLVENEIIISVAPDLLIMGVT